MFHFACFLYRRACITISICFILSSFAIASKAVYTLAVNGTPRKVFQYTKGWFPPSRKFYVRTCVKFTFANKIEAARERKRRASLNFTFNLITCLYFINVIKIYVR